MKREKHIKQEVPISGTHTFHRKYFIYYLHILYEKIIILNSEYFHNKVISSIKILKSCLFIQRNLGKKKSKFNIQHARIYFIFLPTLLSHFLFFCDSIYEIRIKLDNVGKWATIHWKSGIQEWRFYANRDIFCLKRVEWCSLLALTSNIHVYDMRRHKNILQLNYR